MTLYHLFIPAVMTIWTITAAGNSHSSCEQSDALQTIFNSKRVGDWSWDASGFNDDSDNLESRITESSHADRKTIELDSRSNFLSKTTVTRTQTKWPSGRYEVVDKTRIRGTGPVPESEKIERFSVDEDGSISRLSVKKDWGWFAREIIKSDYMVSSPSGENLKARATVEGSANFSKMTLAMTSSNINGDVASTDFTRIRAENEIKTNMSSIKIDAATQKITSTKRQTFNKDTGECGRLDVVTVFDGHDVIQTSTRANSASMAEVVVLNVSGQAKTIVPPTLKDWDPVQITYYRDFHDLRNESDLVDNGFGFKDSDGLSTAGTRFVTPIINENGRTSISNIDIDDFISIFAQSYLGQSKIKGHSVGGVLEMVSSDSDRSEISYKAVLPGETRNAFTVGGPLVNSLTRAYETRSITSENGITKIKFSGTRPLDITIQ